MATHSIITPDGVTFALDGTDVSVEVFEADGYPELAHYSRTIPLQSGGVLDAIYMKPRIVTITEHSEGSTLHALHTALKTYVWPAVRWNRTATLQPLTLRYNDGTNSADLRCYFLGDITASAGGFTRRSGIRLIAYDPLWYSTSTTSQSMNYHDKRTVNYIAGRINGDWINMNNGLNNIPHVILPSRVSEEVFVGGEFTTAGGSAYVRVARYTPSALGWSAMGTGVGANSTVWEMSEDAAGNVYAQGDFATMDGAAISYSAVWSPLTNTWAAFGAPDAACYCSAIAPNGDIYVGGSFTTIGGVACTRVARYSGGVWSALGTGLNGTCRKLVYDAATSRLYAGGSFTTAGGTTVNYIAYWNGSGWVAMDGGCSATVWDIAINTDGSLYVAGEFATSGTAATATSYIAKWNGVRWSTLLTGSLSTVYAINAVPDGYLQAGAQYLSSWDRAALWDGARWVRYPFDFPGSPGPTTVNAVASKFVSAIRTDMYIGFDGSGNAEFPEVTTAQNAGEIDAYPVFAITGPCNLRSIKNEYSGQRLLFDDMPIQAGEVVTIDLTPGVKTITSSWGGNRIQFLLPGSDLGTWSLLPAPIVGSGNNKISILALNYTANTAVTASWKNAYLTVDGAVG